MIDEKKLKKDLDKYGRPHFLSVYDENLFKVVLDIIENQPKVGEWIPVSEKMPEFNVEVLVCNDDGKIHVALREDDEYVTEWRYKYYCYDSDIWDVEENGEIIAWMPLPEPYKGGVGR